MSRIPIPILQAAESSILEIELAVAQHMHQTALLQSRVSGVASNNLVTLDRLDDEIKVLSEAQNSFLNLLPLHDVALELQAQLLELDEATYSERSNWYTKFVQDASLSRHNELERQTTESLATKAQDILQGLLPHNEAKDIVGIKQSKYEERVRSMLSAVLHASGFGRGCLRVGYN